MWDMNSYKDDDHNKKQLKTTDEKEQKIKVNPSESNEKTDIEQQSSSSGCIIDSGFMSGPQLSGYDTSEGEEEEAEKKEINKLQQKDKELNIATSLSSSKTSETSGTSSLSTVNRKEHFSDLVRDMTTSSSVDNVSGGKINDDNYIEIDSGLILEGTASLSIDSNDKQEQMIIDSGVVDTSSGLSEWFCNLSLKDQQQKLNDLNSSKKKSSSIINNKTERSESVGSNKQQQQQQKQPWQIYYQQNSDGDTQLHIACATGYIDVVSALIYLAPHPCVLDIRNDQALSALHIAVLTGQVNIVRMLLVCGASPIVRDRNGNTPLHLACNYGDMDCVKALTTPITLSEIQQKRNLTEKLKTYLCSLLSTITKSSVSQTSSSSLKLPQDLELRNYDGERCIHLATKNNHINIIRYLVTIGSDINAREGKSGLTPLHIAIEMGNEQLANFILEECQKKLNLETATYSGLTAYQLAVMVRLSQMQQNLQKYGAEPLTPPDSDQEDDSDSDDIDFDDLQQLNSNTASNTGNNLYNSSHNNAGNVINVS